MTCQAWHVLKEDDFGFQNAGEPYRTENQASAAVCPVPASLAAKRLTGGAHHKKIKVSAFKKGTTSLADPNAQFDQIYFQTPINFQLSARYTF